MRTYKGVDIGRIVFACLIPMLHMTLPGSVVPYIQQYIARLGVPFFYAVSGMFLSSSIQRRVAKDAWKRYAARIVRLLLIWLVIYSPFIWKAGNLTAQSILFKTPAYLWYLTGVLVASIPFCFVRNRKVLYACSAILYLLGTIFGDTYRWLLGGVSSYEKIFITTRNGIFFGLPLMCVGELTWKKEKISLPMLIISGFLLAAEITFVCGHANSGDDRSMYILLPVFIYYLLLSFRGWNPDVDNSDMGGISSAIYLMQFGIISVGNMAIKYLNLNASWANWGIYLLVVIIPILFYKLIKKTKLARILF